MLPGDKSSAPCGEGHILCATRWGDHCARGGRGIGFTRVALRRAEIGRLIGRGSVPRAKVGAAAGDEIPPQAWHRVGLGAKPAHLVAPRVS